ncbi:UDP-phosphate galactose phosphotransferase [Mycobacterium sp. CBMA 213]|uniref:sugar transferase n=2 Tax=unclassified Mycolicibacterium TaxID=2636767 RepID=UPI001EE3EAE5|nr:sugar transferase [Mycolicibacterium sp. CBMA 335]MUM05475.1 UDP-phosphate galactose phosphotransferase [Mycolicibacterium sp. CBMA 213]
MAIRNPDVEAAAVLPTNNGKPRAKKKTFAERARTDPLSTIITVSIDAVAASVATILGAWWSVRAGAVSPPLWVHLLFPPLLIVLLALRKAYRRPLNRRFLDEIEPIETSIALACMLLLSDMILDGALSHPGRVLVRLWVCASLLLPAGRLIRIVIQRSLRRRGILVSPILIVGNGHVAGQVISRLESSPEYGLVPVGIVDAEPWFGKPGDPKPVVPHLGSPADFDEIIRQTAVEGIVIAFSRTSDEVLTRVIRSANLNGLRVWVVPRMFDTTGAKVRVEHVGGLPLVTLSHTDPRGWQFTVKHVFDRVVSALLLLLISPVFVTLVVLVKCTSPGPVFFRQPRVGRDGRVFGCLKFRTMREPDESSDKFEPKVGSAPGGVEGFDRRTTIGKVLRATSLDELPQFVNVLRGEMSLVGPRPERPEFVDLFEAQIRRYGERHRVRAGVTGWAQVHGLRGQTSIDDRAEWDNYYIENWSLSLDLKILALTIPAVLRRAE